MSKSICCEQCGKRGVLLFPIGRVPDTTTTTGDRIAYLCVSCSKVAVEHFKFDHGNAEKEEPETSHVLKWKLRDENGHVWIEEHAEMTLTDFEVVYGNNIHEILWMTLRKKDQAII